MRYLTTHLQANVSVLWVTCRWLSHHADNSFDDLSHALRPDGIVTGADTALRASLAVGKDIGVLAAGDRRQGPWSVGSAVRAANADWFEDPIMFRGLVRRALLDTAVAQLEAGQQPSDVAVGLAWLMAQDPADPPAWSWGAGPETAFRQAGLKDYLSTEEQWLGFRRWALALGMATILQVRQGRAHLVPDPSAALAESLQGLPARVTATEFYEHVSRALPAMPNGPLGRHAVRASSVPGRAPTDARVGPALAYALHRLQSRGSLKLIQEDDARDRVDWVLHGRRGLFDRVELLEGSTID